MHKNHYYTLHGCCPCKIGEDAVEKAARLYETAGDTVEFVREMARQEVIGKAVRYSGEEDTIFITKRYACESGGGCPENETLIGQRCHCGHYNYVQEFYPKYYCKCGAEFYRPMFAPLFGEDVLIEPYKTVLSGDEECVLAIRIGRKEDQ